MKNKVKRVASFTVFSNDFKSKLTTAYPFLTPDQIQLKLRKKWNDLTPEERNYYHKAVLCPVVNTTKKESKSKKRKKILSKVPKEKNIHLKELTLFDDDLELISDKKHENDCFYDIFNRNEENHFFSNFTKYPKTYMKCRYNIDHPVPMVIDETPFGQQGILKKSSSEKDKKMKVQFNFSPERNKVNQNKKQLSKNDYLSTLCNDKETKKVCIKQIPEEVTKVFKIAAVNSKNEVLSSEYHRESLESNEESSKNISANNHVKPNQNLSSNEQIEPLTPELQRNITPLIIQKMCQAPRKKTIKGNFISVAKTDFIGKRNEVMCVGNVNKLVSRKTTSLQKNNLIEENSELNSPSNLQLKDEEFKRVSIDSAKGKKSLKNVKDLKMMNATKANQCQDGWDFFTHSPSPSLEDQLHLSDTKENINTSIGWELYDEVSAPVKHSSALENTLQQMKKSVSSSLASVVSNNSDSLISDCSSLSGFSELSVQEMDVSDISDNEKLNNKVFCEKQYTIASITTGEDSQNECQILRKNKEQNERKDLLCDMFEDKHTLLTRILPTSGNNGENIAADMFEDESIFG